MTDEQQAKRESTQQKGTFAQALGFAWDFGIIVVAPLVAFGIAGKLLDKHYATSPWFLLGGLLLSIGISVTLLVVRLQKIIERVTKNQQPPTPPHEQ